MKTSAVIKRIREEIGDKNQQEIADFLGLEAKRIKNLEADAVKKFKEEEIEKIVQKTGLSRHYILTGEETSIKSESTITLPLVTNIRAKGGAGNGLDGIDSFEVVDTMVISRTFLKTPPTGTIRVIGIEGYSMVPMLYPDTFVIFDENAEWRGDGLYILNWRNDLMVKLLQIDPYGKLHIKSANKDYESWVIDPDDQSVFHIVGKVLRIII